MPAAFLCAPVRTPIGRVRGALSSVRPDDLAAIVIRAVVDRSRVPPDAIDEVILGCANQAGEDNRNVARMAALLAGLPQSVTGVTVNRLCGSGMEAVIQAARAVRVGDAELVIAGGVESMTRAPWVVQKPAEGHAGGPLQSWDTSLGWRFPNPRLAAMFPLEQMGETAENVAERWKISREAQDAFALSSHRRALAAEEAGRFEGERVAIEVPQKKGPPARVEKDEGPRADTTLEALARLRPVFREGGTVTAGNSSGLNDGAAALLVASEERVRALGLAPMARLLSSGVAGVDPRTMGIGPVPATRKALARAGLTLAEIDLCELNEAFAAQALACLSEMPELDPAQVNPNGGAIALGHPLGCSGTRILVTLIHEMARRRARRGLATMCIGVGQGIATVVERV